MTTNELLEETTHTLMNSISQKVDDAVLESLPAIEIKAGKINLAGYEITPHGIIKEEIEVPEVFDEWKSTLMDEVVAGFVDIDFEEDIPNIENTMKIYVLGLITRGGEALLEPREKVEGFDFYLSEDEENELIDWVDNNKLEAIKAVLFGYKIKEQLYYVILPKLSGYRFLNYDSKNDFLIILDDIESQLLKTRFTMEFIEEHFPEYKQFAVKVEEADAR
ncbi:DUF1642 domain-containing protein [Pediococcus pentosaceus]|uniref:DUF1642 domain-containing protein n=1 Tax=Pediococcus pentosaceus TaxID=1255 RepID=A0ABD7X968_PEDPE|nr:DUF1642 domain-containing protein [Pediococcus pentosaceus]WEA58298.1 DUF1642 domain-containing protein [Pediococcus pentosaceus]